MIGLEFSQEERNSLVSDIQTYMSEHADVDLGQFEAEDVLQFFVNQLGKHFYNKGLLDAQALLLKQMDSITEAISQLEKV